MFYVMLNRNYGEIRVFTIIGAFLGMLLYFLSISKLFMTASLTIIDFITKMCVTLFNIIMAPLRLIYKILAYPARLCQKRLMKFYANLKKLLHKSKNYAKIKRGKIKKDFSIIFKKV
jgi:hypothetical protein